MISACAIPLCVETLIYGTVENLSSAEVFVSFTDVATGFQNWLPASTDEDGVLTGSVLALSGWFSQHKVYKIAVHQLAGNSCPDYCITLQAPDGGELTGDTITAGFVKVNSVITNYKLILK